MIQLNISKSLTIQDSEVSKLIVYIRFTNYTGNRKSNTKVRRNQNRMSSSGIRIAGFRQFDPKKFNELNDNVHRP